MSISVSRQGQCLPKCTTSKFTASVRFESRRAKCVASQAANRPPSHSAAGTWHTCLGRRCTTWCASRDAQQLPSYACTLHLLQSAIDRMKEQKSSKYIAAYKQVVGLIRWS